MQGTHVADAIFILTGLLNRLSEANVESISSEVSLLFQVCFHSSTSSNSKILYSIFPSICLLSVDSHICKHHVHLFAVSVAIIATSTTHIPCGPQSFSYINFPTFDSVISFFRVLRC